MTKQECAIVMAHTGICMLTGNDFSIFHKYVEGIPSIAEEIKECSKADFLRLCAEAK